MSMIGAFDTLIISHRVVVMYKDFGNVLMFDTLFNTIYDNSCAFYM